MPFMNFLVHSYTCCSDRHASPYWTFIRRWISMGFTPSVIKKRMTDAVLLWWKLQGGGPPFLHYYCAVVLHSCNVLPPVGHSSNHECHCCQFKRQSSCVENFYRTLKFSFDSPSYLEGTWICEFPFFKYSLWITLVASLVTFDAFSTNLLVKNKSLQYGHSLQSLLRSSSVLRRVGFPKLSSGCVVFEYLILRFLIVGAHYFYPVSFAELLSPWASFLSFFLPFFFSLVAFFFLLHLICSCEKNW